MYARAHEIVGILYSYADEGHYKKVKTDEKEEENFEDNETNAAGNKDSQKEQESDETKQ